MAKYASSYTLGVPFGFADNVGVTMKTRFAMFALAGALALGSACRGNTSGGEEAVPVEPTYVKVQNRAYLDMNIYVFRSSQRIRLGTVNGRSESVV